MTISRDDFDKGRIDFRAHLAAILESMPHIAFTMPQLEEELSARLGGLRPNPQDLTSSLRSLKADRYNCEQGGVRPHVLGHR